MRRVDGPRHRYVVLTAATSNLSFAALRHRGYRGFFLSSAGAMMADSIEHVISYWVIADKFHSPELGGFAVISHWLPFLLLSIYSGALTERFDPRRMIQLGMLLFMSVSVMWGVLFLTDSLQTWHAKVLLVLHGMAGVLWNPPSQVLLHDIVPIEMLPSAVRLNATARYLGMLAGPAIGSAIFLAMGPAHGILFNALLYLPTIWWLWKAPYGPRFRQGKQPPPPRPIRNLGDILDTLKQVGQNRVLTAMIVLGGCASFFVGNAYQAQMPVFARDLGHGDPGLSYSALLLADALGALSAGLILESRNLLQVRARTALMLALLWCCVLAGFAGSHIYILSLILLFIAGFVELSFNSMAQTLVQLNAPPGIRGRVIGVFSMAALGMRTFSGVTVGVMGGLVGVHVSLATSALTLLCVILGLLLFGAKAAATQRGAGA